MSTKTTPRILAVAGPTATGKTLVGASVAKALGSEVISVDSQLVYRELDIGVAKPTPEEMQGVPHHMIDVIGPEDSFSAGHYAALARPILKRLLAEEKIPVLVGGTGFYLRSLLQSQHVPTVPTDEIYRQELLDLIAEQGLQAAHDLLTTQDPNRASQIHPNDQVRIVRALEIIHATGKPVAPSPVEFELPTSVISLTYADRDAHIAKIRERLDTMVEQGFLDEVSRLYEKYGYCFALQNAHGYPELVEVLLGQRTLEDALTQIAINIRQYSKRQMTWFKRVPEVRWYFVDQQPLDEVITDVLSEIV